MTAVLSHDTTLHNAATLACKLKTIHTIQQIDHTKSRITPFRCHFYYQVVGKQRADTRVIWGHDITYVRVVLGQDRADISCFGAGQS